MASLKPTAVGAAVGSGNKAVPFRVRGDVSTPRGFEAFYAEDRDHIARTLALGFNDDDLGYEAADEAMVRAYRNWSSVSTYNNPEGWVFRVGLNWGRSWIRRRLSATIKAPLLAADQPVSDIQEIAVDPDSAAALVNLKPNHRIVVVLRFYRDYSVAQISDVLDVPEGTVKSRLNRAMKQLATELETTDWEDQ